MAIFELSDIDLVGAPTNVSALARMEVRVLPLGILIAQSVSALVRMEVRVLPLGILITLCAIKIPRGKTRTSIRASALTLVGAPTKSMSLSSKIAKRMPENHS